MKDGLRAELVRRSGRDQDARMAHDGEAASAIDAENLPWIRQVIDEHGWPGRSEVGDDGALATFLLVQHADADPAFQRRCLGLLTEAAGRGEAHRSHLALLTDRVLVAEGRPQEYGTQLEARGGTWAPVRLREPETADERRAAMSLGPLAEYVALVAESEGPPGPFVITMSCPRCQHRIELELADPDESAPAECPGCGLTFRVSPAGDGDATP